MKFSANAYPSFVKQIGAIAVDAIEVYKYRHGEKVARSDVIGGRARYLTVDRKGADPAEWPKDLRVREWPLTGGSNG